MPNISTVASNLPVLAVTALLLPAGIGCGGTRVENRVAVSGTVIREGSPVSGSITFLPKEETRGPAASTSIINGTFRFSVTDGPSPGSHRVVVTALGEKNYNGKKQAPLTWSFEAEIESGDGKLPAFEITSP